MPDFDEQPAWEYPVSSNPQGDGGDASEIRWRPWPCSSCCKGSTPLDFLRRRQEASRKFPKGIWNKVVATLQAREVLWLAEWTERCPHTREETISFPELARGSEHAVHLDESTGTVTKVTLPGCFGDWNYFEGDRICQAQSTPLPYLNRLLIWRNIFGNAPSAMGMTLDGRIVTTQKFITGEPPTQPQVDHYLASSGMIPWRQACFLWKSQKLTNLVQVGIGDTRDENFVLSDFGIVPIDLRFWWLPRKAPAKGVSRYNRR